MSRDVIVISGGGDAITVSVPETISELYFQDLDDNGTITYVGKSKKDGTWQIAKTVGSSDLTTTYASVVNNATKTTYALAWADRLTLVYEDIKLT